MWKEGRKEVTQFQAPSQELIGGTKELQARQVETEIEPDTSRVQSGANT
jgi:hypothetical protein